VPLTALDAEASSSSYVSQSTHQLRPESRVPGRPAASPHQPLPP